MTNLSLQGHIFFKHICYLQAFSFLIYHLLNCYQRFDINVLLILSWSFLLLSVLIWRNSLGSAPFADKLCIFWVITVSFFLLYVFCIFHMLNFSMIVIFLSMFFFCFTEMVDKFCPALFVDIVLLFLTTCLLCGQELTMARKPVKLPRESPGVIRNCDIGHWRGQTHNDLPPMA